jgi:hypothetical protein
MEEITNINDLVFPHVQEGDRISYNEKWYVYSNGNWVEENN